MKNRVWNRCWKHSNIDIERPLLWCINWYKYTDKNISKILNKNVSRETFYDIKIMKTEWKRNVKGYEVGMKWDRKKVKEWEREWQERKNDIEIVEKDGKG